MPTDKAEQGPGADCLQRPLFDEMCSLTIPVIASSVSLNEGILLANSPRRSGAGISRAMASLWEARHMARSRPDPAQAGGRSMARRLPLVPDPISPTVSDRMLHTSGPISSASSADPQGGLQTLAITHIFPLRINALPATLKEAPLCTEPFGGRPLRVTFRAQT